MALITVDQAVSANQASFTVPTGKTWTPVSIGIRWDAGSVEGLRLIGLRLLSASDQFWNCKTVKVLQPKSSTRFYSFSRDQTDTTTSQNALIEAGLPGWILPAGFKLWVGDYQRISSADTFKIRMIIDEV